MTNSLIVEILLGVLAVAVGFVSFVGQNRASRAQSEVAVVNIDAQAYERAQAIYESAIATLERRVTYLEAQVTKLNKDNEDLQLEVAHLRLENAGLREG